jgi:hypothetical protein
MLCYHLKSLIEDNHHMEVAAPMLQLILVTSNNNRQVIIQEREVVEFLASCLEMQA